MENTHQAASAPPNLHYYTYCSEAYILHMQKKKCLQCCFRASLQALSEEHVALHCHRRHED